MEPIPERLTVHDPRAALAFARASPRAILFALMRGERSSTELQTELGLSLSLLHYHLARLRELRLVRTVRQVQRAGRPIAIYSAAARSFLVTGASAAKSAGAGLRLELDAALERARVHAAADTVYCLDHNGAPRMMRTPPGRVRADGEWWWRLDLSPGDAEQLGREVREVVAKYRDRSGPGTARYLYHFAAAKT